MWREGLTAGRPRFATSYLVVVITALSALAWSCSYGIRDVSNVPDNPTFNRDIYPLFVDHCVLCHGSPPNRGAPSTFRLDVYDDQGNVAGAKSMSGWALSDVQSGRMPPAAQSGDGVGPNGLQMLERWVHNGSPQ
jgi:hypothetical protein